MKKLMISIAATMGLFISPLALGIPAHAQEDSFYAQENPLLDQNFWGKYDSGNNAWTYATAADVMKVIKGGADVDTLDDNKWTPLHYAARVGTEEAVKALLAAVSGSAINTPDNDKHTPLHHAAGWNERNPKVVQLLLNQGAEVDVLDKDDYTPLMAAAKWNANPLVMQTLLDFDAGMVAATGAYDMTPLHYAAANNTPEVVKLLLERGAKVNAWSKFGRPLELAKKFNTNPEVASVLAEYSAWD